MSKHKQSKQVKWTVLAPIARITQLMINVASGPMDDIMPNGGVAKLCIVDDGTFLVNRRLVADMVDAYDQSRTQPYLGGARNTTNTVVILYAINEHIAVAVWVLVSHTTESDAARATT